MREKLIALLDLFGVDDDWYTNHEIADYLIAHGVTIQDREIDFDYEAEVE